MKEGWPAKDLLKPLWRAHGGRKAVAKEAGVSEGHLSKVNAGKTNLGLEVAQKFASVVGVSLLELGAPLGEAQDPASLTLLDRLEALSARVDRLYEVTALGFERLGHQQHGLGGQEGDQEPL